MGINAESQGGCKGSLVQLKKVSGIYNMPSKMLIIIIIIANTSKQTLRKKLKKKIRCIYGYSVIAFISLHIYMYTYVCVYVYIYI